LNTSSTNHTERPAEHNELVMEIGSLLLADTELDNQPWQSLALVVTIGPGVKRMSGFWYQDAKSFQAFSPDNVDVLRRMAELNKAMAAREGKAWQQCLVHIVKPELTIDIQFEYDDATRWFAKSTTLDRSDYANSLRPKQ